MSQRNPIKLFVGHAWEENDDYLRVFEYLESDSNFYYQNFSTPDRPPASTDREVLREDLRRQINPVEIVVMPSMLYGTHPDLALFQLNYAKACEKPVVVLEPYGVVTPVPKEMAELADEVIGWDKRSLTDAIRRQARHEDTTRFDTIEFKLD